MNAFFLAKMKSTYYIAISKRNCVISNINKHNIIMEYTYPDIMYFSESFLICDDLSLKFEFKFNTCITVTYSLTLSTPDTNYPAERLSTNFPPF